MPPPDMRLGEVEFVAFDLETTGLDAVGCRIVEFGAVRFTLGKGELDCFEQLVDPGCPIPRDATEVNGITDAMVGGMPTVAETLPRFLAFLGGPESVWLAHNACFDLGFLGFALARLGAPPPANPVLDTLDLSHRYVHQLWSHRLENVARHLGVARREDHRALSDARLVMAVFQTIVGRSTRLVTLGDLFRVSPPLGLATSGVLATEPPAGYEDLAVAIEQGRAMVVVYEGGTRGPVERRITPKAFVQSGGREYVIAYCHIDHMEKTFRLDRIRSLRIEQ